MVTSRQGRTLGIAWSRGKTQMERGRYRVFKRLKNESRTYNSLQLAQKLEKERSVKLSADRLRRILKKRLIWKRAIKSHKGKQTRPYSTTNEAIRLRYVGIRGSGGRN